MQMLIDYVVRFDWVGRRELIARVPAGKGDYVRLKQDLSVEPAEFYKDVELERSKAKHSGYAATYHDETTGAPGVVGIAAVLAVCVSSIQRLKRGR